MPVCVDMTFVVTSGYRLCSITNCKSNLVFGDRIQAQRATYKKSTAPPRRRLRSPCLEKVAHRSFICAPFASFHRTRNYCGSGSNAHNGHVEATIIRGSPGRSGRNETAHSTPQYTEPSPWGMGTSSGSRAGSMPSSCSARRNASPARGTHSGTRSAVLPALSYHDVYLAF